MQTFSIPYVEDNFPGSAGVVAKQLNCGWFELLRSALTIGRPNFYSVFKNKNTSIYEAIFRLSLIKMALKRSPSGHRIMHTDAFRMLDRTEKGAVNYFIGMTLCGMFARQQLDTDWLLHIDVFCLRNPRLHRVRLLGNSVPDLIGKDVNGNWNVFEAKGRSKSPSRTEKAKAKFQATQVTSVDGKNCTLHVGSFSFFRQRQLEFYWCDPPPERESPLKLNVEGGDWEHYYAPALSLATKLGSDTASREASAVDVKIKIHPEVHERLLDQQWGEAHSYAIKNREKLISEKFLPDGLRIEVGNSWL